ncbi:hypothetical protein CF326_g8416 [Tilletia indica]|nr:hypothetical protein CF326_g8416 [Tilletia indica]
MRQLSQRATVLSTPLSRLRLQLSIAVSGLLSLHYVGEGHFSGFNGGGCAPAVVEPPDSERLAIIALPMASFDRDVVHSQSLGSTSVQAGRHVRLEAGFHLFLTTGDFKLVNELADKEGSVADEIATKSAERTELVQQGEMAPSGLDTSLVNSRQALQAETDAHKETLQALQADQDAHMQARSALEASDSDKRFFAVQLETVEEELAQVIKAHDAEKRLLKQHHDLVARHAQD